MLMTLCSLVALAGTPGQEAAEALEPLKFLIGTWTGQGKLRSGEDYTDEIRVEWMQNQQFIRSEYTLKSGDKVVWTATSILGFDHEKKRLFASSFAMNGASSRTDTLSAPKKDTYVFEGRAVGPGYVSEDRITNAKVDEDTFTTTVESKKDGAYVQVGHYVYKRKK